MPAQHGRAFASAAHTNRCVDANIAPVADEVQPNEVEEDSLAVDQAVDVELASSHVRVSGDEEAAAAQHLQDSQADQRVHDFCRSLSGSKSQLEVQVLR